MKYAPLFCALLVACGGGGSPTPQAPHYTVRALVNLTDSAIRLPQFNASFWQPTTTDPVAGVAQQAQGSGAVGLLTQPSTKGAGFAAWPAWIEQAHKYANVRYAYVYDEMFWEPGSGGPSGIAIGANESAIYQAAAQARAAGLLAAVTMPPAVVMAPDFALKDANALDVIALDLYPSSPISLDTHGCAYDANPYTTLLYCAVQKLRSLGFAGQIWYVPQAFAFKSEDHAQLIAHMQLQAQTMQVAPSFGVTGIAPYGLYWSLPADSPFIQGHGSDIEPLVDCHAC